MYSVANCDYDMADAGQAALPGGKFSVSPSTPLYSRMAQPSLEGVEVCVCVLRTMIDIYL